MSPTPELNLKEGWDKTSFVMKWFTRVVRTAYAWSDMIIAYRQKKADTQYKIQKAEEEAYRIMEEQYNQRKQISINKSHVKRDWTDIDIEIEKSEEEIQAEIDLKEFLEKLL
jgi:hypothetical protein